MGSYLLALETADFRLSGTMALVLPPKNWKQWLIEAIKSSLCWLRLEIRGFGSFSLNYRPPRLGRNPKTGEKVAVPEKYVPHFKAGKELRERVDCK